MSLTLYFHPLSGFCQKTLVALYENDTPFTPQLVNFGDATERADFLKFWPIGKFPLLRDDSNGRLVPETSLIIEYLTLHYPGPVALLPESPVAALEVRRLDRLFDLYVAIPMQKVVLDRLRPEGSNDPVGVAEARATLASAYDVLEAEIGGRQWALGDDFSLADCSAAPALFYAERALSFRDSHPRLWAYFERLRTRPSYARALAEAEPYFQFFPRNPGDAGLSR
ncbi:glutathione S-transferase family protein [Bosea sp. (in: a-proteobacteria)]|jgi:glutathione S-transferase|uniref:glutathione S-transferase family protein n=1 Tax=Bosea sp. (in: a-proteobacteria) TaxID=1871050 RepID=UPI002DDDBB71|nr:glutathione S-transferase family protein [Bosea sp. (in: a-proteobacteria)]HEV2512696.1 glutathione S-transferase family protein [Bosea sp. (in: a-proteobacteria)]